MKDKVMAKLESDRNTVVAMDHWPHAAPLFGFPDDNARPARPLPRQVLRHIEGARSKDDRPSPAVVVTHSVRGIVLKGAAKHDAKAFTAVRSVVIYASATKLKNSHQWLGSLKPKVRVTRSEHDGTLNLEKFNRPFIGLGMPQTLVAAGLAPGVFNLDVTNQEVSRPYFYARQSFGDVGPTSGTSSSVRSTQGIHQKSATLLRPPIGYPRFRQASSGS